MIPKILHICWFGGKPLPNEAKKYIDTWRKYNPDYEIKLWDESNFDIKSNTYVYEAYQSKKYAFVSDYARLKVLYDYGGIYMDTDVEVVKSFDDLLEYPAFIGFEAPDRFSTATMASAANNLWVKMLLKNYDNKRFILEDGNFDMTTNVTIITGSTLDKYPVLLNDTLQVFDNFAVLPFEYLCAKDIDSGKIKRTPNTYTIHHYSGSWLPRRKKFVKMVTSIFGYRFVGFLVKIKQAFKRGKSK